MESQTNVIKPIDVFQFERSLIDKIYPIVNVLLMYSQFVKTDKYLIVSTNITTGDQVVDNFLVFMKIKNYINLMIIL